jgi:hypothetical protein
MTDEGGKGRIIKMVAGEQGGPKRLGIRFHAGYRK